MERVLVEDGPARAYDSWAVVDRRDSTTEEVVAAFEDLVDHYGIPRVAEEDAVWLTIDAAMRIEPDAERIVDSARAMVRLVGRSRQILDLFVDFVLDLDDDPEAASASTRRALARDFAGVAGPALDAVDAWASRSREAGRLRDLTRSLDRRRQAG